VIRFAQPQDAPALLEIYRPYVEETPISFETEVPSVQEFGKRMETFSQKFPYLVAQENGVLLGYAYAHAFHQRAAFDWTVETSIYVRMDARGQHIGTALYGALLRLLKAQGVETACAVVTIPNEPSVAFHRRMGFQTGGLLPQMGYKLGTWYGVAYLYLHLGAGAMPPKPVVPIGLLPEFLVKKLLETP
jgi:phosphinothricin acetyltransferase